MNIIIHTKRNDYIDYLKGCLIFLVIYGHSIQYIIYKDSYTFYSNPAFKLIYIFHMPLFMAISGYVSYNSINKKTLTGSISSRFNQLIIPIICWAIIYKSALYIGYLIFDKPHIELSILLFLKSIIGEIVRSFGFLWCVFGSVFLVSLMRIAKMDNWLLCLVLSILLLFIPDIGNMYMFKYIFPFFCLGYCVAKSKVIFPIKLNIAIFIICLLMSLICFLIWDTDSYIYISKNSLTRVNLFNIFFRYISGVIVSITFIAIMSIIYRIGKIQIMSEIGKNSLSIYILQTYAVVILSKIFPLYDNRITISLIFMPLLAILITIILYFISRPLCHYAFLGGNRTFLTSWMKLSSTKPVS